MGQDLIQRWINDFAVYSSGQNNSGKLELLADKVLPNQDLQTALFNYLDDPRSHERVSR